MASMQYTEKYNKQNNQFLYNGIFAHIFFMIEYKIILFKLYIEDLTRVDISKRLFHMKVMKQACGKFHECHMK